LAFAILNVPPQGSGHGDEGKRSAKTTGKQGTEEREILIGQALKTDGIAKPVSSERARKRRRQPILKIESESRVLANGQI